MDASESRSEIRGNDVNVVLEKDGEDEFDRVRNEEVLHTVNKENAKLHTQKRNQANWVVRTVL